VPPDALSQIAAYGAALLERNQRINLTGAGTVDALLPQILDSLTILPFMSERHIDVGSGGGLPAIPAALVAHCQITLVESRAKKAAFLREIAQEIGIGADVVAARAEEAAHFPALRERFSSATARAVGPASTVAELTLPFLRIGGRSILQRGSMSLEERAALEDALLVLDGRIVEQKELDADRRLLVVEKAGPTPARFPRRSGVPSKRPLGARSFHGKPTGETE